MAAHLKASLAFECSSTSIICLLSNQASARRLASNSTGSVIKEKSVVNANMKMPISNKFGNLFTNKIPANNIHCTYCDEMFTTGTNRLLKLSQVYACAC